MANGEIGQLGASVIQRSFVPADLGVVVNIAAVPASEILIGDFETQDELLRWSTAELLGIPDDFIIDDREYFDLGKQVRGGGIRDLLRRRARTPWAYEVLSDLSESFERGVSERAGREDRPVVAFAEDALALLASAETNAPASFLIGSSPWRDLQRIVDGPRSTEALRIGFKCLLAGADPEDKVREFITSISRYDIPTGQSPRVQSDSLLKLLETGKKMCLAPLALGGTLGITQLGQGAFVASLLTVGTGAAMTIILIGTVAVGDLIVRHLMQRRPSTRRRR